MPINATEEALKGLPLRRYEGRSRASVRIRTTSGIKDRSALWLFATLPIAVIPIEKQFSVLGFSIAKVSVVPLLIAVLFNRPRDLLGVVKHGVFTTAVAFVVWGAVAEALHPAPNWDFVFRILQMLVLAALVATVASTAVTFKRLLVAITVVCTILAFYLVFNFYGAIDVEVANVREAGLVRSRTYAEMSLAVASNLTAYTVAMGAVIALPNLLKARRAVTRVLWGSSFLLCAVGSFVPLSRGAFVALLVGSAIVIRRDIYSSLRHRKSRLSKLVMVGGAVVVFIMLMPASLTERFSAVRIGKNDNASFEKTDSRTALLETTIEALPQYWILGVGFGNYFDSWASENGFGGLGPHSGFFTAWIFYGFPGLSLLVILCLVAARHGPKSKNDTAAANAVLGLLGVALVLLLFTHCLYLKSFGIVLGLLIASSRGALTCFERRPQELRFVSQAGRKLNGNIKTSNSHGRSIDFQARGLR